MQISGIASNTACVAFQRIEAANIADLASVLATASFLIYNSGASFSATVRFQNPTTTADDFSALTSIASNSITVQNGWATITTSVSLTSGVARGLQFEIDLLTAMTAGRTVQVTGVQLEAGSVATPFERRDYGRELMMCQRYYTKSFGLGTAPANSAGGGYQIGVVAGQDPQLAVSFPVEMRSAPAITLFNPYVASPAGQWFGAAFGGGSGSNARAFGSSTRMVSIDNTDVGASNTGWCEIAFAATSEL
jgi:hypothetical protein